MTVAGVTAAGGAALLAVGVLGWLRTRYVVVTVRGESMSPTYRPGERVLVRRVPVAAVRRDMCVVFAETSPGEPVSSDVGGWLVKRVVAAPGDPVPRGQFPALREVPEPVVPPGRIVVAGDNAPRSFDSRHFGYVAAGRVLGVVLRRI